MSRPLITLTTDFGLSNSYVAQMKGVILAISPNAVLVDVTHQIPPQDCQAASAVLADAVDAFAPEAIHLVVVDPGVGTDRRAVAVEARGQGDAAARRFVAPDNGVLTGALQNRSVGRAVCLTNPSYWRPRVSNTFHGRDVFGPVAAYWSLGVDLAEFGPPLDSPLVQIPVERPVNGGGALRGRIVRADSFGNLVTNLHESLLPERGRDRLVVELDDRRIAGMVRTYAERPAGELVALVGSSGYLEVAVVCGSASRLFATWRELTVLVQG